MLETGLGGRLDATNIVPGERVMCTAITSIGRDHEDILGSELSDIAFEKSGIIKNGVGGCIVGPTALPFGVFRRAYEQSGGLLANFHEISAFSNQESASTEESKEAA